MEDVLLPFWDVFHALLPVAFWKENWDRIPLPAEGLTGYIKGEKSDEVGYQ